jgi:hypothetical protein
MRWIFGSLILAASCWFWSSVADEIALFAWGVETRALVKHVSQSSHRRGTSYTAYYEFTTEDKVLGNGSCPTHKGTEGRLVKIVYLKARPSVNRPDQDWYGVWLMSAYGAGGFLLCLWGARVFLRRPKRLGGYPDAEGALHAPQSGGELHAAPAVKHWRNRWGITFLLAMVLSGALVVLCVASVSDAATPLWRLGGAAAPASEASTPTAEGGESAAAPAPAPTETLTAAQLGTTPGNAANASLFGFDKDSLYVGLWRDYNKANAPAPGLYRMNLTDGAGLAPVGKLSQTENIYQGVNVLDGWVYYLAMQGLNRVRVDGTGHKQLTEDRISWFCVAGGWIYYQQKFDRERLWRMKVGGGGAVRLTEEEVGVASVSTDGRIYYTNKTDGGRVYSRNHDGSARRKLSERTASVLVAEGGTLWFVDGESGQLCRMGTDGGRPETIVEDKVSGLNVSGDRVYFSRSGGVARCRFDGSEMEPVARGDEIWQFLIHRGRVYFRNGDDKTIQSVAEDGSDPRSF